jgi:hypothetical protein
MKHRVADHSVSLLATQIFWGVMLLFCGCAIYLLFRSQTINLYQWSAAAGFSSIIEPLRQSVHGWQIPNIVRFSLPDGLYCASYILLMDAAWKGGKASKRIAVSLIPLIAISHELLQGMGLVRGTFDLCDLACYAIPLIIYFAVTTIFFNHFFNN